LVALRRERNSQNLEELGKGEFSSFGRKEGSPAIEGVPDKL